NCTVMEEEEEWNSIENPYEFTSPPEKTEMELEDLFTQYPSLKPSTESEVIQLKRSFMAYLAMDENMRAKILSGHSTEHKELTRLLKELIKFVRRSSRI
ncbi:hypothetical protein PMAYCL1PPCAC_23198, partial [Pristionchus mayeri]